MVGIILPAERVVSRESVFNTSPEILYKIVTNNKDWQFRRDLKALHILESCGEYERWEEEAHNGNVIRFKTKEKRPYAFYSFEMSSPLFDGYWTANFIAVAENSTHFMATEHIRMKNPFMKTLSYLFFDIGKLMEQYQDYLRDKVAETGYSLYQSEYIR